MSGIRAAYFSVVLLASSLALGATAEGDGDGAVKLDTFAADRGRFDQDFDLSPDGRQLAVVESDGESFARIRVRQVATGKELAPLDITSLTVKPLSVRFADGGRLLLVWQDPSGNRRLAALVGGGRAAQRFGPAQAIQLAEHQGLRVVVVRTIATLDVEQARRRLVIELYKSSDGSALGAQRVLSLDGGAGGESVRFQPEYWRDQGLTVVGMREGQYDPKLDQKLPDHEAWYSFASEAYTVHRPIRNPIQHRKDLELLAKHSGQGRFVAPYWDLSKLLTVADGRVADLEFPGDLESYDRQSLVSQELGGSTVFSMVTDAFSSSGRPQPTYFELFTVRDAAAAKPLVRLRKRDRRHWEWRVAGTTLAIMHRGMGRGGKRIELYQLARAIR